MIRVGFSVHSKDVLAWWPRTATGFSLSVYPRHPKNEARDSSTANLNTWYRSFPADSGSADARRRQTGPRTRAVPDSVRKLLGKPRMNSSEPHLPLRLWLLPGGRLGLLSILLRDAFRNHQIICTPLTFMARVFKD